MPQLTATEWAGVVALCIAYLVLLFWLRARARRDPTFHEFTLHGPALPSEFDKVFGAYADSPVKGLLVLSDGIRVNYEDGQNLRFMPVPCDATIYYDTDGQLKVAPPAGK